MLFVLVFFSKIGCSKHFIPRNEMFVAIFFLLLAGLECSGLGSQIAIFHVDINIF